MSLAYNYLVEVLNEFLSYLLAQAIGQEFFVSLEYLVKIDALARLFKYLGSLSFDLSTYQKGHTLGAHYFAARSLPSERPGFDPFQEAAKVWKGSRLCSLATKKKIPVSDPLDPVREYLEGPGAPAGVLNSLGVLLSDHIPGDSNEKVLNSAGHN